MKAELKIKQLSMQRGIRQSTLARLSGVDLSLLSRYWNGKQKQYDATVLYRVAVALDVDPGDLFVKIPKQERIVIAE